MGEYCTRLADKQFVKMGTCAHMYYLRFEDMSDVEPEDGSSFGSYFRLPWPDEDHHLPGDYCEGQPQGGYRELDITSQYIDGEIKEFVPAPSKKASSKQSEDGVKAFAQDICIAKDGGNEVVTSGA